MKTTHLPALVLTDCDPLQILYVRAWGSGFEWRLSESARDAIELSDPAVPTFDFVAVVEAGQNTFTRQLDDVYADHIAAYGVAPGASHIEYLASLPLSDALWWFIENINADTPLRTEMFFALRERMRNRDTTPNA